MKKDNTKVLIIVAHPDDAEISMGMRIYDYVQNGCEVFVHSLSMGGKKDNSQKLKNIRVKETQEASNILGIHSYTFSDFPDTFFEEDRGKIRSEIEKLVVKIQPDVVYTHYPEDLHIDHEITSKEVLIGARSVSSFFYFRSPYSRNLIPKIFFFGDEKLMDKKIESLKCFASQKLLDEDLLKTFSSVIYFEYVHPNAIIDFKLSHGMSISDLLYAEAFIAEREFILPLEFKKLNGFIKSTHTLKEKIHFLAKRKY